MQLGRHINYEGEIKREAGRYKYRNKYQADKEKRERQINKEKR